MKQLTLDTIRRTILTRFAQHEILGGVLVGIEVAAYPRGAEDEQEGRVAGYDGDFVAHSCIVAALATGRDEYIMGEARAWWVPV